MGCLWRRHVTIKTKAMVVVVPPKLPPTSVGYDGSVHLFGSAIGLPTDFWSFGGILAFLGVFGFDVTCVRLCRVVVAGPSSSSHP